MDDQNNCLRVLESYLISFSMLLQAVCLAAPGWMTELRKDNRDNYRGLFYFIECKYVSKDETECETKSWHDQHNEDVQGLKPRDIPIYDYGYHVTVKVQVMLLVSFALTVACLVLQYHKNKSKSLSTMVLITAATMSCLVLAGAFIISYLASTYIEINYRVNYFKLVDDNSLGFPYCVLLDTIAFLAILFTVILDFIEIRKVMQEHFVPGQSIPSDNMMPRLDNSNITGAATGGHVNSGMAYVHNK